MDRENASWTAAEMTSFGTRLFAIGRTGQVLDQTTLPALPASALAKAVKDFAHTDDCALITCGLAEDGHRALPAAPMAETLPATALGPYTRIGIPGLSQSSPAAQSGGAETRIAGFLKLNPDFDGVLCLTGPQSTWAHVSANEVVSMQVFATGQLADALAGGAAAVPDPGSSLFEDALSDALAKPERLASSVAAAIAEESLQDLPAGSAQARQWGALLGAELAATRPYWLGQQVAVIGNPPLADLYSAAMRKQGLAPIQANGDAMLLKGFSQAWERCKS